MSSIRYTLAVAAGKGGVGKSTVAVNLALTLQKQGYQVGLLDADIYGPSFGVMMPLEKAIQIEDTKIIPGLFRGIEVVSLAYLRDPGQGLMVRAPVANGLITQCIEQSNWGELDYLIVDFPPGTGDVQLTLMQTLSFSGALIVTTPQEVSIVDVKKAAAMFDHMGVYLLGVIENMSYFMDPLTGTRYTLFGEGGGEKLSDCFGIPFLGKIPVEKEISLCSDQGRPFPWEYPQSEAAQQLQKMARDVAKSLFELEELRGSCQKKFEYVWKEMECLS